mmetsp:Transcript_25454/g.29353  ORF Transcript_25454/g.29353 Transcript_25454/m.29353 type:complete len:340 (+) Transcript_25454:124-1143(+)
MKQILYQKGVPGFAILVSLAASSHFRIPRHTATAFIVRRSTNVPHRTTSLSWRSKLNLLQVPLEDDNFQVLSSMKNYKQVSLNNNKLLPLEPPFATPTSQNRIDRRRSTASPRLKHIFDGINDTMGAAGFENSLTSKGAGASMKAIAWFTFVAVMVRFARIIWAKDTNDWNEAQPNWGFVITDKKQEAALNAWTCKRCGTTFFIARRREWRFMNVATRCHTCGAQGKKSFYDRRQEIQDEEGDAVYKYESPKNYKMSKEDRNALIAEQAEYNFEDEAKENRRLAAELENREVEDDEYEDDEYEEGDDDGEWEYEDEDDDDGEWEYEYYDDDEVAESVSA